MPGWTIDALVKDQALLSNFLASVVNWFNDAQHNDPQKEMLKILDAFASVRTIGLIIAARLFAIEYLSRFAAPTGKRVTRASWMS